MAVSNAPWLEAAAEVARVAGTAALAHFRPGIEVETKQDGSPVTIADRAAEAAARSWIETRFPEDGILGEEFGETRPGALRRWILDPIDGTKTFVRGVPLWGSLVAIAEGERVLAGAADFPALNERLAAAVGEGCWWNGARCRVSEVATLAAATVLTTDERFNKSEPKREDWLRVASRAGLSRTWGDCYGYMLVATGRAEAMLDPRLAPWDAATFMPILEEAGGRFTDWSGRPTAFGGSAVATNAGVADELRSVLANGASSS